MRLIQPSTHTHTLCTPYARILCNATLTRATQPRCMLCVCMSLPIGVLCVVLAAPVQLLPGYTDIERINRGCPIALFLTLSWIEYVLRSRQQCDADGHHQVLLLPPLLPPPLLLPHPPLLLLLLLLLLLALFSVSRKGHPISENQ